MFWHFYLFIDSDIRARERKDMQPRPLAEIKPGKYQLHDMHLNHSDTRTLQYKCLLNIKCMSKDWWEWWSRLLAVGCGKLLGRATTVPGLGGRLGSRKTTSRCAGQIGIYRHVTGRGLFGVRSCCWTRATWPPVKLTRHISVWICVFTCRWDHNVPVVPMG